LGQEWRGFAARIDDRFLAYRRQIPCLSTTDSLLLTTSDDVDINFSRRYKGVHMEVEFYCIRAKHIRKFFKTKEEREYFTQYPFALTNKRSLKNGKISACVGQVLFSNPDDGKAIILSDDSNAQIETEDLQEFFYPVSKNKAAFFLYRKQAEIFAPLLK